jgi:dTDP-4-dehydrorhamnose 3,5-epimerase-like enzyme
MKIEEARAFIEKARKGFYVMSEKDKAHDEYTTAVNEGRFPEGNAVPLGDPFVNQNGFIENLLTKPNNHVSHIFSHKGTVRANHWHKTDWHYAYVVRGKILYFERPVGSTEVPEPQVFTARQQFFTPPNREHAMLFAEDTDFITMARNVRLHEQHEEDVVRMSFVTPELAAKFLAPPSKRVDSGENVVITDDDGEPD